MTDVIQVLPTDIFDNEDAAAAAVRVCYASNNLDHELATQIHKHLQGKLDEGGHKPVRIRSMQQA